MQVYHVTTEKKLARYFSTGCILAPVRFWTTLCSAYRWAKKTGREVILSFDVPDPHYPLPIKRGARWSTANVPTGEFTGLAYRQKN